MPMPEIPSRFKMQLLPSLATLDLAMKIPERLQESRRLTHQGNRAHKLNFENWMVLEALL